MLDCDAFAIVLGERPAMDAQGIFGGFGAEIMLLLFHGYAQSLSTGSRGGHVELVRVDGNVGPRRVGFNI